MSFDASLAGLRALDGERLAERLRLVGRCESRLAAVKAETIDALARRDGEARAAGAPIDEAELLPAAGEEPADLFGATVRDHLNERSGDDLEERRKQQRSQRRLGFKRLPDGMFELFGRFDPLTGSRIETAITAAANRLWRAEDPNNRATAQQRLADALESLVTGRPERLPPGVQTRRVIRQQRRRRPTAPLLTLTDGSQSPEAWGYPW